MTLGYMEAYKLEEGIKVKKQLKLRWIKDSELDLVYEFILKSYSLLENKETFLLQSKEDTFKPYYKGGEILGLFDEDENLVAQRYIVFLDCYNSDLMDDINLPLEERKGIIYLKSILVDRNYTGNKLQYRTFEVLRKLMNEKNYYKYISTISPYNLFSIENALRGGLKIRGLEKKYPDEKEPQGYWRYINYLDEKSNLKMENINLEVNRLDIEKQRELISQGFIGKGLTEDKTSVIYDRVV
ncbi:hypothetical protein [Anaerosphaera multitolerans]|uniref:N-acetyltransferase domain-containing protein n=1 Tax=Anaerosphaera multitolerans TaxID=2487351 RepID=A0A437S8G7_9FIRM|nr:hypothetical protein [Anaerosphaera multitolerans]RVU55302.1 hypothetical protein EF514_03255 [Anaerosphaera multitolerans]